MPYYLSLIWPIITEKANHREWTGIVFIDMICLSLHDYDGADYIDNHGGIDHDNDRDNEMKTMVMHSTAASFSKEAVVKRWL